jgi:hypothetical protein
MMLVRELIAELSKQDPDAKVILYINEEECDATADLVEKAVATGDLIKYSKGDNALDAGILEEEEEFVYIVGNIP